MNHLETYFRQNNKRLIDKWVHYFDVYDRHFSRFRNQPIVIVEIGVSEGGSLQMWKDYFGPQAVIYGIDVNPHCKAFEEENIHIFIGSQADRTFLREIKTKIPPIDILIDDGGHEMFQQIISFEELFGHIKADGVYLCEDTHTSYWPRYKGGLKRRGTFMEYSKNFVDYINAWHSKQKSFQVTDFTRSVNSVHFYDSIVVVERKPRQAPYSEKTGTPSLPVTIQKPSAYKKLKTWFRARFGITKK
jgi:cephalosporin hydroxylase